MSIRNAVICNNKHILTRFPGLFRTSESKAMHEKPEARQQHLKV